MESDPSLHSVIAIKGIATGELTREGYIPVILSTSRGKIECRYYSSDKFSKAVISVGGIGGGFDTPAKGLYVRLCQDLLDNGISSLRISFRHPTDLDESVFDVLIGLNFLKGKDIKATGLVGHSFGGAVVIQAAVISEMVKTVVTLSTQSYGADAVSSFRSDQSILMIHGTADTVLSPRSTTSIYALAFDPKKLMLLEGAGHGLDESAEEVYRAVYNWLLEKLVA